MAYALLAIPIALGLAGLVMLVVGVGLRRRGTMILGATLAAVGAVGGLALRGVL